jgi:hypothetical protein
MKARNLSIERKLRTATRQDVKNNDNKLFYFKEALHTSRLKRMYPEDYNNYQWIKDSAMKAEFKESCRKDWQMITDKLFTLLMENNLFIEKHD